jgi:hypothetical protein
MSILGEFTEALTGGRIDVVDLTAPLSADTPVIQLPPPFAQTATFRLEEISRYDERGPAWYWNNLRTGEHTGTHFDAPKHWITGRDGEDVAEVPARKLVGPAAVLDFSEQAAADPDFLLGSTTSASGKRRTVRCPEVGGCSTAPDGTPGPRRRRTSSTPTRPARTRPASRPSAPDGWPRRRR